jgi:hypothetical protein
MIAKNREGYCSDDPVQERKNNVHVELEDLEDYLNNKDMLVYFRLQHFLKKPFQECKKLGDSKILDFKSLFAL